MTAEHLERRIHIPKPRQPLPRGEDYAAAEIASPAEVQKLRDQALKDFLGTWHPEDIKANFVVIAASRGLTLKEIRPPQTSDAPSTPLSSEIIATVAGAVYEYDDLTSLERTAAGLPYDADVVACAEYLDHIDPSISFIIKPSEEQRCTYSCNCSERRLEHQREVLFMPKQNGVFYDPETKAPLSPNEDSAYDPKNTSPRVKALRDKWRKQYKANAEQTRKVFDSEVNGNRRFGAAPLLSGEDMRLDTVDPKLVELLRDAKRITLNRPTLGIEEHREALQKEYLGRMRELFKEYGLQPPSDQAILAPGSEAQRQLSARQRLRLAIKRESAEQQEKVDNSPQEIASPEEGNPFTVALEIEKNTKDINERESEPEVIGEERLIIPAFHEVFPDQGLTK